MKKMLWTMAALSALAAAAPAAAQYGYSRDGDVSIDRRIDQLEYRLEDGIRRGAFSDREANGLRTELWQIRRLEGQYGRNGFSSWELNDLDRRILFLGDQLRGAEPSYDRGGGYDRSDDDRGTPGYDQGYSGRYDDRDDRPDIRSFDPSSDQDQAAQDDVQSYDPGAQGAYDDNDALGWDNAPDTDADQGAGAYDDSRNGEDLGPPEADRPPNDGAGPLRIGDPAPADLGPVPPQLRGLYPDGNGVYYRYDGDTVYQIDARTGTIRWIGDLPQ